MWAGTFIYRKEWVKVLVSIEGKEMGNKLDEMLLTHTNVYVVPIKVGFGLINERIIGRR